MTSFISDGLLLLRENEVIYANRMGKKILGLSQDFDATGLHLDELVSEVAQNAVSSIHKSIAQSLPIEFHFWEEDREWIAFIHTYLIVSDQASYNRPLRELPVLPTSQIISPMYLVRAQDVTLLSEIQAAKSHFLGTLSHEVKTPVTSLMMAIRLLERSIDDFANPVHQTLIKTCAKDIERLRTLIDEFMGVSQLDSLSQSLNLQSVSVSKLVSHSVQAFKSQALERQITMHFSMPSFSSAILVEIDAIKMSWVFSKLLTNALRHTPQGGKVDVSLEACEDRVSICIRDTGPGIERSRLDKIFEKYSSHYDLRVGRTGSLGLSLAISRDVVTAHGGRIEVKSALGLGTEFKVSLPRSTQRVECFEEISSGDEILS